MGDLSRKPIGFFDSGIGGISVLNCARRELPSENFIYYGDNANAPYGDKTEEEIQNLSLAGGEFLVKKGVKAIVVACNTATSASIRLIRDKYNIPVVSMEPAVKPAAIAQNATQIMVLATAATLSQHRFLDLLERIGCAKMTILVPCAGLVEILEDGDFTKPEIEEYLDEKFAPHAGKNISGIVIGCTHYSFIADKIAAAAKRFLVGECRIYDGMDGTVRQLRRVLEENNLVNKSGNGAVEYYSSGKELVGNSVSFKQAPIR